VSTSSLPFSANEYVRRLELVQNIVREREFDWVILDEPETMGWLSGYSVSENLWRACVVPAHGESFLLVRKLDIPPARQRTWLRDIVGFSDWENPLALLASTLRSRGRPQRIGVDFQSNSYTRQRQIELQRELPETQFVDLERSIWDVRRCKSAEEVIHFREASRRLDTVLQTVVAAIRSGVTQREMAATAAAEYYRLGFDDGLIGYITSGTGWDALHGFMSDDPIKEGAVVHIELLPRLNGYSARIMRSVVVGKATQDQKSVFEALCSLQDRQIAAMRPGMQAVEVDALVRDGAVRAGLRPDYDNITGYTLGYGSSTSQRVSDLYRSFTPAARWRLEEGMVFHMYTSAQGLAVSETVLVTASGGERLTRTPRVLFESAAREELQ
jgi:Xaa-Pro aminopeptidase